MLIAQTISDGRALYLIFVCIMVYLIPSIVAVTRGHPAVVSIMVLNILLGWTLLFWAIALIWAAYPIDTTKKYR